jgi:hypothetical protein
MTSTDRLFFAGEGRRSDRRQGGQLLLQFGYEVSGSISLDVQDICVQAQNVADQDVKVPILLEPQRLRVMDFANEIQPSRLTHPIDIVHNQRVPLGTMAYATAQPLEAFCQFRKGLPKSVVDRPTADRKTKYPQVCCGCVHTIFHVNLASILRHVVNSGNDILVDTNPTRRDHQYVIGDTFYE